MRAMLDTRDMSATPNYAGIAPGQVASWADVLAIGPNTGANNPIIDAGQFLRVNNTAAVQWGTAGTALIETGGAGGKVVTGTGSVSMQQTGGVVFVDTVPLWLGTGGRVRYTPTATELVVTGTVDQRFADDFVVGWGGTAVASQRGNVDFSSLLGLWRVLTPDIADDNAAPPTAGIYLQSGARETTDGAGVASGDVFGSSGPTDATGTAASGGASGAMDWQSGSTDTQIAVFGGNSGPARLHSGDASNSGGLGTSGNSGIVEVFSGDSDDGTTGNVDLFSGLPGAGQARGRVRAGRQATAVGVVETELLPTRETFRARGVDVNEQMTVVENWDLRPGLIASYTATPALFNPGWIIEGTNALDGSVRQAGRGGVSLFTNGTGASTTVVRTTTFVDGGALAINLWFDFGAFEAEDAPLWRHSHIRGTRTTPRVELGNRATVNAFDDTTDDNKIIVRYDPLDVVTSAVNWVLVTSNGGVESRTDTGIPYDSALVARFVCFVDPVSGEVSLLAAQGAGQLRLVADPANHVVLLNTVLGTSYFGISENGDATALADYVFGPRALTRDMAA